MMTSSAGPIVFTTARMAARLLSHDDASELLAVYGDPRTVRWIGNGTPLSLAECDRWIGITQRNYATRGYGMYALTRPTGGSVLGFVGLVHPDQQPDAELQYALHRAQWGRGLATEAAAGLLRHGVEVLGITRVVATIAPENAASRRVLDKIGMRFVEQRADADGLPTQHFVWEPGHRSVALR